MIELLQLSDHDAEPFKPHVEKMGRDEGEVWAYVEVRPGAHMFWWLYYTFHPEGHLNRPIIIWLQV